LPVPPSVWHRLFSIASERPPGRVKRSRLGRRFAAGRRPVGFDSLGTAVRALDRRADFLG
jgi:hypothetical protein